MAWVGLGIALRFTGEFDLALEALDRALRLAPGNVDVWFALANLHRARGEPPEASRAYRKVLDLDPSHEEATYFLAVVTSEETPDCIPATLVCDLFDSYAPHYEEHLLCHLDYRLPPLLSEAVRQFAGRNPAFSLVMDLGCGTGLCGALLRDMAARLVGVDLSPRMVERARERGIYDELLVEELSHAMRSRDNTIDLAVAGDVVTYLGDLSIFLAAGKSGLREGGLLVFNVESTSGKAPYVLLKGGRFAHRRSYVEDLAAKFGLRVESCEQIVPRKEDGQPILGRLFLLTNLPPSFTEHC